MAPESNPVTELPQLLRVELHLKFRLSDENGLEQWVPGVRAGPEPHAVFEDTRVQSLCLVDDDGHDFVLRPLREVQVKLLQKGERVLSLCRDAEVTKNALQEVPK